MIKSGKYYVFSCFQGDLIYRITNLGSRRYILQQSKINILSHNGSIYVPHYCIYLSGAQLGQ